MSHSIFFLFQAAKLLKKTVSTIPHHRLFVFFDPIYYNMWKNSANFTAQNNRKLMNTRNLLLGLVAGLMLTNCAEDVEKLAQPYLTRAQQSYETRQFALAKLQIDSIKELYPKAFEARKQAQALLIDVELAEARTSKYYTDSLIAESTARTFSLAASLYLDKDAQYQDYGTYYAARHRTEKNVGKTYLRPQTSEKDGAFTITAFYRGKPIGAHTLRFTAPDGSYVDLQPIAAPHVMSDAAGRTERTDFAATPDVAHFAAQHASIKVTVIGDNGKAQIPFAKADAQALAQVADLATALQASITLQAQQQELTRRITFYEERQARQ